VIACFGPFTALALIIELLLEQRTPTGESVLAPGLFRGPLASSKMKSA
jgi:hypothetical protein